MPLRSRRSAARLGAAATGLLAAAVVAVPAYADTTADLAVKLGGGTIAADASGKFGIISLLNHGPSAASGVTVTYDVSAIDPAKVELLTLPDCEDLGAGRFDCALGPDGVAAGADLDLPLPLIRKDGAAPGAAGKVTVSVRAEGTDPKPDNNTATAQLTIAGNGVDLLALAPDVYLHSADDETDTTPIPPGQSAVMFGLILNQGDRAALGVKAVVKLPAHVTFAEIFDGCVYSADKRTATCTAPDVVLVPADQEGGPAGSESVVPIGFPVTVAADAPGPVGLTGGLLSVASLGQLDPRAPAARKPFRAPSFITKVPAGLDISDVDPTDNDDEFTVFTAAAAAAGGGGGTGGGTGGGLPVTGVQVGAIGGVGAGVVVLGAMLFLVARRRRVVLVTPADGNDG